MRRPGSCSTREVCSMIMRATISCGRNSRIYMKGSHGSTTLLVRKCPLEVVTQYTWRGI